MRLITDSISYHYCKDVLALSSVTRRIHGLSGNMWIRLVACHCEVQNTALYVLLDSYPVLSSHALQNGGIPLNTMIDINMTS